MISSPLVSLLKSFDKKEMTRFKSFVYSPYHNKHKGVQGLVDYLNECYPLFRKEELSENSIWDAIGMNGNLDKKGLSMIFTYTQKLALEFLSIEQFKSKNQLIHEQQLIELRERKQFKLYKKVKRSQSSAIENLEVMDAAYFLSKSRMFHEENALLNQQGKYDRGELVDKKLGMLDRFYLTEKLKDACELFQRAKGQKQKFISPLNDFALNEIKSNIGNYSDAAPLVAFFHIYQMLIEDTDEYFQVAKKSIHQYKSQLTFEDKNDTYNTLLNFCILRINKGLRQYLREAFELFKILLEEKLLIISGILPEWHYKNIVTIGLLVNEIKWTKLFIEEYKNLLSKEYRENAYNYNLASLYYKTKNYQEMYPLLLKVEYTDWRYALAAKVLLLKTYYDTAESEALESLYDSFRQYVKRNKGLSENQKRGYNNLIKFTHRVFNLKTTKKYSVPEKFSGDIIRVQDQIKSAVYCLNKNWILEKLSEMK